MKENLTRTLGRMRERLATFSIGQKVAAAVGVVAVLAGLFLVLRWLTTPSFSPLYSSMSSADAAVVMEELAATGVAHELSADGTTVMVPSDLVHETRIALSGAGLPSTTEGGYSLLDGQSLSTSQFQEQTSFKRAMEGELAATIGSIDGVKTAVVHLALPAQQVFATEQDPATASVLVATDATTTLTHDQVQAVIHLVASSIEGLAPEKVTVADATGKVLSATDSTTGTGNGARNQAVLDYQEQLSSRIQRMLDTVLGPGNSTVAVTADLDFDKSVSTSTTYNSEPESKPVSRSEEQETFTGPGAADNADAGVGGTVGPEGNAEDGADGDGSGTYNRSSSTEDNALNSVVETRESAPGSVNSLHIGVAMDDNGPVAVGVQEMRDLISAAIGENLDRGDTVEVTSLPFDRSVQENAEAEIAAVEAAEAADARAVMIRNIVIATVVVLALLAAWIIARRRARARAEATEYVVEQLRLDAENRAAQQPPAPSPAVSLLESSELDEVDKMRDELASLVERQPEDVAALLRGWLVEPPR